jgi:hypothetical protein
MRRERVDDGYSNDLEILVDKITMGGTGAIKQRMEPEYFRSLDITKRVP